MSNLPEHANNLGNNSSGNESNMFRGTYTNNTPFTSTQNITNNYTRKPPRLHASNHRCRTHVNSNCINRCSTYSTNCGQNN